MLSDLLPLAGTFMAFSNCVPAKRGAYKWTLYIMETVKRSGEGGVESFLYESLRVCMCVHCTHSCFSNKNE